MNFNYPERFTDTIVTNRPLLSTRLTQFLHKFTQFRGRTLISVHSWPSWLELESADWQ